MNPLSSAPLAERIGPLLQKIPHKDYCEGSKDFAGPIYSGICICDREKRVAQAVARAIAAAIASRSDLESPFGKQAVEASLRALADTETR